MTQKRAKPAAKPEQQATPGKEGAHRVGDMQRHFLHTGSYRAEDLNRVLGDPRDHVEVAVPTELEYACRLVAK